VSLVVARHTLEIGGGYTLRMMHPFVLILPHTILFFLNKSSTNYSRVLNLWLFAESKDWLVPPTSSTRPIPPLET
jgi:hypothetical protein